jgi:hypothetical protein
MSVSAKWSVFSRQDRFASFCLVVALMPLGAGFGSVPASAQAMQFTQVSTFTPPYSPPYILLTGDLNHDGKPDWVVLTSGATGIPPTAYVLLGNGDGSFGPASGYAMGGSPNGAALADLQGNGDLDLIVSTISGGVSVLLGNGDGTFQPLASYLGGEQSVGVTVGDFNGDKRLDLAASVSSTIHSGFAGYIRVLLNNGDGTFGTPVETSLGNVYAGAATSGDLNGDGKLDVAVNTAPGLQILLGNGDGTFQTGPSTRGAGVRTW